MVPPAPRFQTPGPQNWDRINVCSFQTPSVWHLIMAAAGNPYLYRVLVRWSQSGCSISSFQGRNQGKAKGKRNLSLRPIEVNASPLARVTGRADSQVAAVVFKLDRFPPDGVRVLSISG